MTANSLKKQDIDRQTLADKETARHNRNQEFIGERANALKQGEEIGKTVRWMGDKLAQHREQNISLAKMFGKNDFSWYTSYPELVGNLLKQSVDDYAGTTEEFDDNTGFMGWTPKDVNVKQLTAREPKPCIVSYQFIPTIGNTKAQSSAASMAIRKFNTKVRGANSGATNYDSIDLFQYPLATDSILYILAWIERGLSLYTYMNPREPFTVAYGLISAHCFGDSDLIKLFTEDRYALIDLHNRIVEEFNTLNIPFDMAYVKRHVWLCSTIFYNGEHVGREYFIVNPKSYGVYDETNGKIDFRDFVNAVTGGSALSKLRKVLDDQINALLTSQSIATMSGDIEKAYGQGIKLQKLSLDGANNIVPNLVNDVKYLQSFKNAILVPIDSLAEFSIQQGLDPQGNPILYQGTYAGGNWTPPHYNGALVQLDVSHNTGDEENPVWEATTAQLGLSGDRVIDYYDENTISEEDQCYNLSFHATLSHSSNEILDTRSEILTRMMVYRYIRTKGSFATALTLNSNIFAQEYGYVNDGADLYLDCDDVSVVINGLTYLASYNFLPLLIIAVPGENETTLSFIWNRNKNRNAVKSTLISEIQYNTLLSLFNFERSYSSNSKRRKK